MNKILEELSKTATELTVTGCKNPYILKKHLFSLKKLFIHFNMNNLKEMTENKQVHELLENFKFIDVYKAFLTVNFEQGKLITPTQQILLIERIIELVPSLNINQIILIVITSTRKGYNDFYPAAELFEPANKGLTEEQQKEIFKNIFQTEVITDSFMSAFKKFYEYKRKDKPEFKYTEVVLMKLAYKIRENCLGERVINNVPRKVVDLGVAIKYLQQTMEMSLKNPSKYGISVPNMEKEKKHDKTSADESKQYSLLQMWINAKDSVCSIPSFHDNMDEIQNLFYSINPIKYDGKTLFLETKNDENVKQLFSHKEVLHALAVQLGKNFLVKIEKTT
jgi:hypothetical protein